jgi:hypothetical protein
MISSLSNERIVDEWIAGGETFGCAATAESSSSRLKLNGWKAILIL